MCIIGNLDVGRGAATRDKNRTEQSRSMHDNRSDTDDETL